jgi:hypothetical protein
MVCKLKSFSNSSLILAQTPSPNSVPLGTTIEHDYESVVIDSLDWLERLVWDSLCQEYGVSSIEKVDGGYARG